MGPLMGPLRVLCLAVNTADGSSAWPSRSFTDGRLFGDLAPISLRSRSNLARQAFLDTLLTDALVSSADGESNIPLETQACTAKLPPAALLEAVVRCALAKFGTVNVLTTAGKTAALIEVHACRLSPMHAC